MVWLVSEFLSFRRQVLRLVSLELLQLELLLPCELSLVLPDPLCGLNLSDSDARSLAFLVDFFLRLLSLGHSRCLQILVVAFSLVDGRVLALHPRVVRA